MGRLLGFAVKHVLEVLDELRTSGELQTEGIKSESITFHDSCQLVRCGGVQNNRATPANYVEMTDHGTLNWCCGTGGGVSANEDAHEVMQKAFLRRKSQLDELQIDTLMTACANCRIQFEDQLEEHEMELPVVGVTETIAAHLKKKSS